MSQDPFRRSPSSQSSGSNRGSDNEWLGEEDPLAELARLVGHPDNRSGDSDLYASGRQEPNFAEIAPPGGWAEPVHSDPDHNEHELFDADQPYDDYRYPDEPVTGAQPEERAEGRKSGSLMIASVLGIAILGTVGVVGYRYFSGTADSGPPPVIKADARPSKEVPAGADASQPAANKQSYDRATDQARVVEPEEPAERPVGQPRVIGTAPNQGNTEVDANGVRRVRTFVVRPDGSVVDSAEVAQQAAAADQPAPNTAASGAEQPQNAVPPQEQTDPQGAQNDQQPADPIDQLAAASQDGPPVEIRGDAEGPSAGISFAPGEQFGIMSETPAASTENAATSGGTSVPMPAPRPASLAAATPQQSAPAQPAFQQAQSSAPAQAAAPAAQPARGGGFVVQVSSQRTEADAQRTFAQLQQRFPQILGSYQPSIQPANLGDRGTYYRVRVGPFASRDDAAGLCMNLKTAGGDCVVQAN